MNVMNILWKGQKTMNELIMLAPVFKETIWGGNHLKEVYGFDIPSEKTGENWCISAHPNGDCVILNTPYQGKTLSWLYQNHRELFGHCPQESFPILVKFIDANDNLSVQVHPNDEYARKHENSLGKSECWYILDCVPGAKLVMGHHAQTIEEFKRMIDEDCYDELLDVIDIHPGDFFWIPSGTLHAICQGTLVYEVQQSSDITYRVYDYHRLDANGKERPLHIKESLAVTTIPAKREILETTRIVNEHIDKKIFLDNEFFKVSRIEIKDIYKQKNHASMRLVSVLEGTGTCNDTPISKGMSFIIPSTITEINYCGMLTLIESTLGGEA